MGLRKLFFSFLVVLLFCPAVFAQAQDELTEAQNTLVVQSPSFKKLYLGILRDHSDLNWSLVQGNLPGRIYGLTSVLSDGSVRVVIDVIKCRHDGKLVPVVVAHEFKHLADASVDPKAFTQAALREQGRAGYHSQAHEKAAFDFQDVVWNELTAYKPEAAH